MQTLLIIAAICLGLYLLIGLALYTFQRGLIYYPDTTEYEPADAGLIDTRMVRLETQDGETLVAWYRPAEMGQPTLLYFHGNAGGLVERAPRIERFGRAGYGVFMPAYRGYAGSTGKPSEAVLVSDAQLAYEHLRGLGLTPEAIVPYGESLGTGVAVRLAASRPVGALVLDAPYTSLPDVGKRLYPFFPVEPFMVDRFESKRHITNVDAPILILHGTRDAVIPIDLGRALYEIAPEPKEMVAIEGAGHSDIYLFGAMERLQRFLGQHLGAKPAALGSSAR